MFPFTWVFLFQNVSYFLDSPRINDVFSLTAENNTAECSELEGFLSYF